MSERASPAARRRPARGCWSPAPPATPARWPPSWSGATRASSSRAATSRGDAGTRLDELYPRYRVPVELDELDLDDADEVDAAIVAYPHGASAPVVAELRGLGVQVVDLSADFRLRDLPTYERWYGAARRARAARRGRLRAAPSSTASAIARGRAGRQPGLLPDRGAAGAGAAGRGGPGRRRRRRRQVGRLGRRPRRRRASSRRRRRRERHALRGRGPPPRARDRARSSRRSGSTAPR